jgi:hypothetical protein
MGFKSAGLPQHGINKSGLAMVNVGDDCDITKLFAAFQR